MRRRSRARRCRRSDGGPALLNVGLVGVGLIGGSLGLAVRERLGGRVRGWDPDPAALRDAVRRGALDEACSSLPEALVGADHAWTAAPVAALPAALDAVLAAAPADCVVSDVGSTKAGLLAGRDDPRLVGGHPLAGAETSGVANARADLFDGATWFLTPTATTAGVLYERLHHTLARLGARPVAIEPDHHDRLMAGVSHLPHVLADVLVGEGVEALAASGDRLPALGPSFRDATRVAGANPAIWPDIFLANREALLERIAGASVRLDRLRAALEHGDREAVVQWNARAREDRRGLLQGELAGGPLCELRVSVPNEPGVVARIALALGRAGVNISDMALYPAPDARTGVVALWVAGEAPAQRAAALIAGLDLPVARA